MACARPDRCRPAMVLAQALGLFSLAACGLRSDFLPEPLWPERTIEQKMTFASASQVDFLFVIDDSDGMREEQAALARAFPHLVDGLRAAWGSVPDARFGVVSPNLGAAGSRVAECAKSERAALQAAPRAEGGRCAAVPSGRFLATLEDGARNNFPDSLADAFACISQLGTAGCGFEQHLGAARRALDADQPIENQGFLRPDAVLALVILADEDDCSAASLDLFEAATARFGPQRSFRCNEFGHLCAGKPPPRAPTGASIGPCRPAESAGQLAPVADLAGFFRASKTKPDRALALVIAGPPEPYAVVAADGEIEVAPACTGPGGPAAPSVRLKAFADAFGDRGSFASICDVDLGPALRRFGESVARALAPTCLGARPIREPSGPSGAPIAACRVVARLPGHAAETPIPACGVAPSGPCWRAVDAGPRCHPSRTELRLEGGKSLLPPDVEVAVSCRTCVDPKDPRCG